MKKEEKMKSVKVKLFWIFLIFIIVFILSLGYLYLTVPSDSKCILNLEDCLYKNHRNAFFQKMSSGFMCVYEHFKCIVIGG